MKSLLREPLLHFLLLGAGLFGVFAIVRPSATPEPDEIVVPPGMVENLAASFARARQRPPDPAELQELVERHVTEEVWYREALKLGLDRHDPVIRQRLEKNLAFFAENAAVVKEPTEAELAAYLAQHAERFLQPARFSFHQVFLNPQKRGAQLAADAATLLEELRRDGRPSDLRSRGDGSMLPTEVTDKAVAVVRAQFGDALVDALAAAPVGEWFGPVASAYGLHLIRVEQRQEARVPALAEIREQVAREWVLSRRQGAAQEYLAGLRTNYRVTVSWPDASDPVVRPAGTPAAALP